MVGYKYNEFEIRFNTHRNSSSWAVFKDGVPYSMMAFSKPAVAKKVLDLVFPEGRKSELNPFNY